DVGLDGVIGCTRRRAGSHAPFEEVPLSTVGVVAAHAQDDSPLFLHSRVAIGPRTVVHGCQSTRLRIAALERKGPGSAYHDGRDVGRSQGRVGGGGSLVTSSKETVLEVRHHPGAGASTLAPTGGVAEIDGFHGSGAVVRVVRLRVAVIVAAPTVVEGAAGHHVLGLRLVAGRDPRGTVVAITVASHNVDAVDRMATDGQLESGRVCFVIWCVLSLARRGFAEVVALAGLVIDDRDGACRAGAERVLRG